MQRDPTGCGATPGVPERDLAPEGIVGYGSRVSFWPIPRLFHERGLGITRRLDMVTCRARHCPAPLAEAGAGTQVPQRC